MYRKTIYCYKLNRINEDFHAYDSEKNLNQIFIFYEKKIMKNLQLHHLQLIINHIQIMQHRIQQLSHLQNNVSIFYVQNADHQHQICYEMHNR